MSETTPSPNLEREDFGDVTVARVQIPMLWSDGTTDALFDGIYALVDAGRARLVLNLDRVTFLASAALGKLVMLLRKVQAAGGRLTLCKVHPTIEEILHKTHLADVMLLYPDEQAAVQSFG